MAWAVQHSALAFLIPIHIAQNLNHLADKHAQSAHLFESHKVSNSITDGKAAVHIQYSEASRLARKT